MHANNTPYFHFCPSPDSKTEPRCTCSYNKQTHDPNHAYSLTNFAWSAFSATKHPFRAEKVLTAGNEYPTRWEQCFLSLFGQTRQELDHPVPTKVFLQTATTASMCRSPCGDPTHLPLSHPFCWRRTSAQARRDYLFCAVWMWRQQKLTLGIKTLI